jgi:DNA-binding beta-propeller fold protein YncE
VHAVDLATETTQVFQLRDPDDRNDLVVPIWWEGRLFATSFTAGALFELDPIDGTILGEPLPITESGETEGTVDVVPGDGTLYVLHSLSQRVVAVDPTARTFAPLFTAGAAANRIRLYDGALYVLNSMDNNLTRHDLSTGTTTTPFAIFPPGSNPWKMAFVDGRMYVTAYLSDELFVVDVGSGTIEAVVE